MKLRSSRRQWNNTQHTSMPRSFSFRLPFDDGECDMMAIMGAAAMREKDRRRPVAAETPKTLYLEPERSCKMDRKRRSSQSRRQERL